MKFECANCGHTFLAYGRNRPCPECNSTITEAYTP